MKDVNLLISNGIDINASLELFGDVDTYNSTLEEFLKNDALKLASLKKYKEEADMANYCILVHSLKSDSKYLGFTKLAELAGNHELESKANNMVYVYENYDELITEFKRVLKVVHLYLGKPNTILDVPVISNVFKDKKILVVDDSDIIRTLIKKIFNDEFEVLTASDGKEALEIIANDYSNNLLGVLLDLNMPNVNGFAVLDYFKENDLFTKIPVSIITGDETQETIKKVFAYNIVDVVTKPFNEKNIKKVVTNMLKFY